ncbi:hypothetical protein STEG23_019675 [Scotinomys teguina]
MEVVAAAPRCQLLLIMLMAAMLLLGMKGSPLLVQRTVTRTFELQESIGKEKKLMDANEKENQQFEQSTLIDLILAENRLGVAKVMAMMSHSVFPPTSLGALAQDSVFEGGRDLKNECHGQWKDGFGKRSFITGECSGESKQSSLWPESPGKDYRRTKLCVGGCFWELNPSQRRSESQKGHWIQRILLRSCRLPGTKAAGPPYRGPCSYLLNGGNICRTSFKRDSSLAAELVDVSTND